MNARRSCGFIFRGGFFKGLFVLFVAAVFLGACSSDKKPKQNKHGSVPVAAASAVRKDVPVQLTVIGNVEAYETVSVKSQVSGQILKVHFTEGQDVRKGGLLFTIDPRPFETALKQAEAALAKNMAQFENARKESSRYEELVKKGYVAQSQYDQIKTNADALEAIVNADRAAVENARVQLSYCYIHAPVSGKTGSLLVHQGNIVKANDDKAMVVINRIQPVYVNFSVPEKHLPEIKRRMASGKLAVAASTEKSETAPAQGLLTFVDNAVDKTTGTIRLKGIFENKDKKLWPGQFVNASLTLDTISGAVVVPSQAVQTGQQGQFVIVIKQDLSTEMRPVAAGIAFGGETVIEGGLQEGEKVVTDGHMRLAPGAKVEIKAKTGTGVEKSQ